MPRGNKKTSTEVLERRGSWVATARKKSERESAAPKLEIDRSGVPELTDAQIEGECRTGIPGYDPWACAESHQWFDVKLARKAIEFFHLQLSHVKGAKYRQAFILEPWQRAIIGNLFGWIQDAEDGGEPVRRYREAFILVPRKNGKSPMAAGIIDYLLFEDGEPGAEIYGAASTHGQAALVFEHARGMVLNNDELRERCKVYSGQAKSIQLHSDYSTYRVVSSDAYAAHGWNTHAGVADELHTWPDRELLDAMLTSTAGRRQPLIVEITTADFDRESICNEKHDYALSVRDNGGDEEKPGFDSHFLPVIFEASRDDDWTDEKVWDRVNPNLGVSVSREYLREACKRAQETPSYENTFKRLHLNIRTQQDVRWISLEQWDLCNGAVDEEALAGRDCFGALDLSTKFDISAWLLLFPPVDEHEPWVVLPRFFIPEENARKRELHDRVPYGEWVRKGFLTMTPGNVVDYDFIKAKVIEDGKRFTVREIAYDPWNATQIALQLGDSGATAVEFGQGFKSMSEPAKELEKLVVQEKLAHGGNPVLRWMASNVSIEEDAAGNIKPSKKKSTERIDGIVTLVMALGRAMVTPVAAPNPYEARGVSYV